VPSPANNQESFCFCAQTSGSWNAGETVIVSIDLLPSADWSGLIPMVRSGGAFG
jgi:hypothetical protein